MSQPWHALPAADCLADFDVDPSTGLSHPLAHARLATSGPNRLRPQQHKPFWKHFLEELREPMVLLLLVTGVLYALWGELSDALTIFFVILTLNTIEVVNEQRAGRAIAALRQFAEPLALVRRNGIALEIPADTIVPGDIVLLQAGRRVPADARLLEAYGLATDESALTGESLPVDKHAQDTIPPDAPVAEWRTMVFAGSLITRGRGAALVVATGPHTQLGRVAALARSVKPPRTPLQLAMRELTGWLVWLALLFSLLIPLLGWLVAGQPLKEMILTGLSLAFATIPEELPIIITMVLALGGYRLSRHHAIVRHLRAVETLGAITTIATDKTGTLTENRMALQRLEPPEASLTLLTLGSLCNEASSPALGDPLETALLRAAGDAGLDSAGLRREHPLYDEFSFDATHKRMTVLYRHNNTIQAAVKGAPEAILPLCTHTADGAPLTDQSRQNALDLVAEMAGAGLRVIAFAHKIVDQLLESRTQVESGLTFVGLAGLADPPRAEVPSAIATCVGAGIRTVMITGDHPQTAVAIAKQIGLPAAPLLIGPQLDAMSDQALREAVGTTAIYARTTPEHKLRIVQALQSHGERVAVTGDGINDTPALVAADIGIAMGETGTDAAREAADMVLADDHFATITRAIGEGRTLFANLTKGVRYYLACKVALIGATLLPALLGVPVPFAPVQIILMELFMDLAASAAFVAEPAEADVMRQPPRDPRARFMNGPLARSIFLSASGLLAAITIAYLVAWYTGADIMRARTIAFVTWMLGHVLLALNMRSERHSLWRIGIFSNRLMLLWAIATIIFVLIATLVPPAQALLKTVSLAPADWALAIGTAIAGTFWIEFYKLMRPTNA